MRVKSLRPFLTGTTCCQPPLASAVTPIGLLRQGLDGDDRGPRRRGAAERRSTRRPAASVADRGLVDGQPGGLREADELQADVADERRARRRSGRPPTTRPRREREAAAAGLRMGCGAMVVDRDAALADAAGPAPRASDSSSSGRGPGRARSCAGSPWCRPRRQVRVVAVLERREVRARIFVSRSARYRSTPLRLARGLQHLADVGAAARRWASARAQAAADAVCWRAVIAAALARPSLVARGHGWSRSSDARCDRRGDVGRARLGYALSCARPLSRTA